MSDPLNINSANEQSAIVIGGGIAGLCAARAVSDIFDQVTIIERDSLDHTGEPRKSVPQSHHTHYLLSGGACALTELYGSIFPDLTSLGSIPVSSGSQVQFDDGRQISFLPNSVLQTPRELGINGYSQSRRLLETALLEATIAQPNIRLRSGTTVSGFLWESECIKGIRYTTNGHEKTLPANLVIDCGGRGSHTPSWLTQAGYPKPPETTIDIDLAYCSARYQATKDTSPIKIHVARDPTLNNSRIGLVSNIEGGLWLVTLAGQFGDYPPKDETGFLAYARTLPSMNVYELISDSNRINNIHRFHFPRSIRRHYEKLSRFPEGLVLLGDTLNVINPIYGQGMTTAILQAQQLKEILAQRQHSGQSVTNLAQELFHKYADLIETPWQLAAVQDMLNAKTRMERSETLLAFARHLMAINALAVTQADIHKALMEVFHMRKPLDTLYTDAIMEQIKTILPTMNTSHPSA